MNIIQRNFFRLIRCGEFKKQEQIEPMSISKWNKVYQMAMMHQVIPSVYAGIQQCKDQFFLHLSEKQMKEWEKADIESRQTNKQEEENELLRADHLTNPLLNKKLQAILDDEQSDIATRQLLLIIIHITRHILNEGVPIYNLVQLGKYLTAEGYRVDFLTLNQWLKKLGFTPMAQLEGALLIQMFGFSKEEIPFLVEEPDKRVERVAQELTEFTNTRAEEFYFSQDSDSVFVHTSNSSAILGHIRRSAHYFRYLPSETLTNFFASFAHSLSHIEE
ncbi:MAG: hypothetical protein IKY01_14595 [Prevotella sp.]|nr:hypothetical protein [Prevotella sp.]